MTSVAGSEPPTLSSRSRLTRDDRISVSCEGHLEQVEELESARLLLPENIARQSPLASTPMGSMTRLMPDRPPVRPGGSPLPHPSYARSLPGTAIASNQPLATSVRWSSAVSLMQTNAFVNGRNGFGAGGGNGSGTGGPPEIQRSLSTRHRGELSMAEKYNYDLSKAQLKASSRTSALLAGFAMVALVELQYDASTPHSILIVLGVVTTLLVSVHLLALMMSTCILPYMEAAGATKDSPHIRLKFYVDLSWLFSTCIGLLLFLVEIGVIFVVKFNGVKFNPAAYITTAMLVPVLIIFVVFSYLIHKSRTTHSLERIKDKVAGLNEFFDSEKALPQLAPLQQI